MRLGVADHFGWAVVVAAGPDHEVVDRRRVELVEPGVTPAPIHYDRQRLDVDGTAELVATVRASVERATSAALAELAAALPAPVASISLRTWQPDFPADIATQRRSPYEARADAIMYRQILADVAHGRGWQVHLYNPKDVVAQALAKLGTTTDAILQAPRSRLGPPWAKDHRVAFTSTIVAAP